MATLSLQNVSFSYSKGTPFEKKALDGIDVTFEEGVVTGLIGHTGCGKSTLVQMLNGLLRPDEGKVFLDGKDIWEEPKKISEVRFKVGLVLQYPEYQLFEETVEKDIAYGPRNMHLPEEEIKQRVEKAAFFCGITPEMLSSSPFDLSGGQKRRAAIAGVVAMSPEILILDEPAAGLDPVGREEILGGIRTYQKQTKSTVIIVSHSMEDMASYCDRLVVMNGSHINMTGSVHDIFKNSDELEKIGLDVPQITHLFKKLRSKGINVRDDIFTVEDAVKEVLLRVSEKEGKI